MTTTQSTITVNHDNGERTRYVTHADNPAKAWQVREYFTMYGGRCESFRDHDLGLHFPEATRADADAAMATWVAAR